jgi:recombination protein RecT
MADSKMLKPVDEVRLSLTAMGPEFAKALPPHVTVDKFIRVAMTAVQNNPKLLSCNRQSFYSAITKCAQDGLLPDGREAALVPYGNDVGYIAMVAGIMKKARNSGEIGAWSVQVVKEQDHFEIVLGDEERVLHRPALKERGKVIGAYSIVTLKDGERTREWMNVEEIEEIRKRSRASGSGPWVTDYDEMCKKTVVRRHAKRLPMSTDVVEFLRRDDDVIDIGVNHPPEPAPKRARTSRLKQLIEKKEEPEEVPPDFDDGHKADTAYAQEMDK